MIVAITSLLSLALFASGQAPWSYDGSNGVAPEAWPGLCQSGSEQSPINIDLSNVETENLGPFDFSDYNINLESVKIENSNGKTIKLTPDRDITLSGGSLPGTYKLVEFHFHWPSEHSFGNKLYPLEVHFVHMNEEYASLEEALEYDDGVAVIGVFFQKQFYCYPSKVMDTITSAIKKVEYSNQTANIPFGSSLSELLPKIHCEYFRYKGSLTTPNCNERVTWTLLKNPICVTKHQLSKFHYGVRQNNGALLKYNNRPIQPLNGRIVEVNTDCSY